MQATQFKSISQQLPIAEKQWYAIRTQLNCEKKVFASFENKNIEAFLPLQKYTRKYNRRRVEVEKPLIRNYIFVKISKNDYVPILDTQFVYGFVKFGDQLNAIPEQEINFIKTVTGEYNELEIMEFDIAVGEEIEIIGGQLTGMKARLTERKGKNKVLVELQAVGIGLLLDVDARYIRRLN